MIQTTVDHGGRRLEHASIAGIAAEMARLMLIDPAAEYAPGWTAAPSQPMTLDRSVAPKVPGCAPFLDTVFESPDRPGARRLPVLPPRRVASPVSTWWCSRRRPRPRRCSRPPSIRASRTGASCRTTSRPMHTAVGAAIRANMRRLRCSGTRSRRTSPSSPTTCSDACRPSVLDRRGRRVARTGATRVGNDADRSGDHRHGRRPGSGIGEVGDVGGSVRHGIGRRCAPRTWHRSPDSTIERRTIHASLTPLR